MCCGGFCRSRVSLNSCFQWIQRLEDGRFVSLEKNRTSPTFYEVPFGLSAETKFALAFLRRNVMMFTQLVAGLS